MYIPHELLPYVHVPEFLLNLMWDAYWENEYLRVVRLLKEGKL